MKQIKLMLSIAALVMVISCKKDSMVPIPSNSNPTNGLTTAVFNPNITYGSLTDQDGNTYKTVTIGTQTWMAENLRTTKYNDGTSISKVQDSIVWQNLTSGAYCNYKNTENLDTIATLGRLYNWSAISTGKLAPSGWHVATKNEWQTLINYLGGVVAADPKLKEA